MAAAGCFVMSLDIATPKPAEGGEAFQVRLRKTVAAAGVIVVSGGNTLYAVDRFNAVGLTPLLRAAMERGAVLSGGSAGAICWFDGGHSDSMDPDSYRDSMLVAQTAAAAAHADAEADADESSAAPEGGGAAKAWEYIRVPGLGFLPGLCCPHHDRIQSNGVPRAEDFEAMMRRHGQEVGIAIDHWAALVIDGEDYRILAISDKPGSQLPAAADGAKPPPPLCHQGQDSYADARPGVTEHTANMHASYRRLPGITMIKQYF